MVDVRPYFISGDALETIVSQISEEVDRDAIWTDLHNAAMSCRFERANEWKQVSLSKQKREIRRTIKRLTGDLERLAKFGAFEYEDAEGRAAIQTFDAPWIDYLRDSLAALADGSKQFLRQLPDTKLGQGRPRENHVERYIHALADIYEKHTGKPAKAVANPMDSGLNPEQYQFQQFAAEALIAIGLPDRPGLEQRVYRELQDRP